MRLKRNQELEQETISEEKDLLDDPLADTDSEKFMSDDFGLGDDWGMNSQTAMEKHSDLLKKLTNFDRYIREKINGWLGLRWSENKKTYIRDKYTTPVMNRRCAAWCIDFLKTYTRDNNIITHISEQEYKYLLTDIFEVLWLDIGTRTEIFGIKDDADLHRICVEMEHAAALVLMGAGDGKYTKFLGESTQRTENVSYQGQPMMPLSYGMQPKQRKPGLIGKAKKFFLGG